MINRKYIDNDFHTVEVCENIDILMQNLRYFFNHQNAENNLGMILNLEWSWNRSEGMSLRCVHIW